MNKNKESIKVLFLDIDGVLNSEIFYERRYKQRVKDAMNGLLLKESTKVEYLLGELDQKCINILNKFIEDTGVKIVLSSTWRNSSVFNGIKDINDFFKGAGLIGEFIDVTPNIRTDGSYRGNEVELWLRRNKHLNIDEFVIFDDNSDFLLWHQNNYFKVDQYCGLTPTVCYKASRFINGVKRHQ
jgi:hypothetical protein